MTGVQTCALPISANPTEAKDALLAKAWPAGDVEALVKLIAEPGREDVNGTYRLSEAQAKAILDLKLQRLTGLERDKIHDELRAIGHEIEEYLSILASREKLMGIMKDEFAAIKAEYANPRRTVIEDIEVDTDIESLIQREEMVVTVTEAGYIKRVPLNAYKAQKRGGKGKSGMATKDEDFVTRLFVASTHTPVLFFSSKGLVYKMKVYKLPLGSPTSKGKPFINLLPLDEGETITTIMKLPENEEECKDLSIMFATSQGNVRRNSLMDFVNVQSNGKIAMKLDEGDKRINVRICTEENDIMLAARSGKCIRFPVKRTDHRRAQILVRNYNRMKTGFLKSSHNTFLIINHPIIFGTGGRQNDRHTLMSIIGLGNHIGKMNQPIQFLHPGSRFTFIAIQTPFHRTRRLSHHQYINFTFSFRLHVLCRMEGKIG